MAMPVFVRLESEDGAVEGVAIARHEGKLLPPGRWLVRRNDGGEQLMSVDEMPPHWREQMQRIGRFSQSDALRDLDDACGGGGR